MTGPNNGASEYIAIALPLCSACHVSPITPPPIYKGRQSYSRTKRTMLEHTDKGALPPSPAKSLKTISWFLFCAKPHAKFHTGYAVSMGPSIIKPSRTYLNKTGSKAVELVNVRIFHSEVRGTARYSFVKGTVDFMISRLPRGRLHIQE